MRSGEGRGRTEKEFCTWVNMNGEGDNGDDGWVEGRKRGEWRRQRKARAGIENCMDGRK